MSSLVEYADESSDEFKHLSNEVRIVIREIVSETKTDLPAYWQLGHAKGEWSLQTGC